MKKTLSSRQVFERSILEEDVFGACRTLLELNGAVVHRVVERIPWGKKKSEPGIPDTFGWFLRRRLAHVPYQVMKLDLVNHPGNGMFEVSMSIPFWIELKRPHKADYRPAQIRWIDQARRDGMIAFFADSVEAMVKGFAEFGIKIKGV